MIDSEPGVLPDAVRDTVLVRLHGLPVACRDVLGVAAVLGAAPALAMAERLGDPRALRSALRARQVALWLAGSASPER
jgi:hypothetical protein